MSIICRLRVNSIDQPEGCNFTNVILGALHSPDAVEDDATLAEIRSFFEATPAATFSMSIRNEAATEQFQVGDEHYVRLEKIPTGKTVQAIYSRKAQEAQAK